MTKHWPRPINCINCKHMALEPLFKKESRGMAITVWRATLYHQIQTRKPHPQIRLPSTGTVRPHTTRSEKERRMKWVRLLQLSQTLGVNDIITAFWKHKPAYAFLLPPPPAGLSVLRQTPWNWAASASAIQTIVLPFSRVHHCHQRHSLPLTVGLKQQFGNVTETGRCRGAASS